MGTRLSLTSGFAVRQRTEGIDVTPAGGFHQRDARVSLTGSCLPGGKELEFRQPKSRRTR